MGLQSAATPAAPARLLPHDPEHAPSEDSHLPSFDPSVPNPARMWNYWLGGKDNFAADRQAAERVLEVMPSLPLIARAARLFLIDAVHQLAAEHGIRQFLDIGTGLPTADNSHDVAQRAAPSHGSFTWTTTRWCSPTPRPC